MLDITTKYLCCFQSLEIWAESTKPFFCLVLAVSCSTDFELNKTLIPFKEFFHVWIRNWSCIVMHFVVLLLVGATSWKKPKAPSFQINVEGNLVGIFFQLNTYRTIDWQSRIFDLASDFQDGGRDVISHRKVLPPGEWTQSNLTGAYAAMSTVPDLVV